MKRIGVVVAINSADQVAVHRSYVDCVLAAGGSPVLLPAVEGMVERTDVLMAGLDGVLLTGGGDIDPARYGQKPMATLDALDPVRDELEAAIITWAKGQRVRLLAICRGAQLIAGLHGGTLIQDLPSAGYVGHRPQGVSDGYASVSHQLTTRPGSLAASLLGAELCVNSHHHQGIVDAGHGIEATGWSDDGLIEVIEADELLGVQWHPERMAGPGSDRQSALFEWLIND